MEPLLPPLQRVERPEVVIPPALMRDSLRPLEGNVFELWLEGVRKGKVIEIKSLGEVDAAFKAAMGDSEVVAFINSVAPITEWSTSGRILNIARMAGVEAIDGVTEDNEQAPKNAQHALKMGYYSKLVFSEEQSESVAKGMTPPNALIAEADDIVDKYYKADMGDSGGQGLGAIPYSFNFDRPEPERGLVDEATAKIYRRVLKRALELGLLSETRIEKYNMYALENTFSDGTRVDFTRNGWEFIPETDFNRIRLREDLEVTAIRGEDGRFIPTLFADLTPKLLRGAPELGAVDVDLTDVALLRYRVGADSGTVQAVQVTHGELLASVRRLVEATASGAKPELTDPIEIMLLALWTGKGLGTTSTRINPRAESAVATSI